jgi:hypothetical protein
VISTTHSIRSLIKSDPPRAYYSAVALGILSVCRDTVTPTGSVIGVMGREVTLQECPVPYRPLMTEFVGISSRAKQFELEDDQRAIEAVQRGKRPHEPRLDRLKRMLESGVAEEEARYDHEDPIPSRPPPKDWVLADRSDAASGSGITASVSTMGGGSATSSPRTSSESTRGKVTNVLRKTQNPPWPVSPASPTRSSLAPPPAPRKVVKDEEAPPRRSEEGTTLQLANRINALALKMTGLKLFRENGDMIFAILQGVS